jgi:hypothetical protein
VVTRRQNILFVSARDSEEAQKGRGQIWIIPTDGGEATVLTSYKYGASNPKWSPNVYYINPRGSSSYGEAWTCAVGGNYGERDYKEIGGCPWDNLDNYWANPTTGSNASTTLCGGLGNNYLQKMNLQFQTAPQSVVTHFVLRKHYFLLNNPTFFKRNFSPFDQCHNDLFGLYHPTGYRCQTPNHQTVLDITPLHHRFSNFIPS